MADTEKKVITKTEKDENADVVKRKTALTYAEIQQLLLRNVRRSSSRSYTQYTKDSVKTYLASPGTNTDNLREVSRFLERNSMLYKKIMLYFAATPLYYYNVTPTDIDFTKTVNAQKQTKSFLDVTKQIQGFNMRTNGFTAIYLAVRDGMFVGYTYFSEGKTFFQILDPQYCRIWGKNEEGQWNVYFNAAYFSGNNSIYVEGIDGDTTGVWDDVFVEGYKAYQADRTNCQWFALPPDRTCCLLSVTDDMNDVPVPYFSGLFISLLDLLDYEQVVADKTELENYKLLVNKIPLISGSQNLDDFALSMSLAEKFDRMFDNALPELVGHVLSPGFDVDVIDFDESNTTDDTDILAQSIENLFNNAGVSQIVVAGGKSTNSVGLTQAIQNDTSNIWFFVDHFADWVNYFIKEHFSDGYALRFHKETWFNRENYVAEKKDAATLGGAVLDYLTALGDTPFMAYQKIQFDNMLGLKNLMIPLQSSYNTSSDNEGGRPEEGDIADLTPEGQATRDGEKNAGTAANS